MNAARQRESGFSLIELLIAMVVTLVVTGAIYGLMAGGQSAFRRQPEMTDRQQNIRIAMNMLEEDLVAAGTSLPYYGLVFKASDAVGGALNGGGPAGVFGAAAQATRGTVPDTSANTDYLEFVKADERCFQDRLCNGGTAVGTAAGLVQTAEPLLLQAQACNFPVGRIAFVTSDRYFVAKQILAAPTAITCTEFVASTTANPNGQVRLGIGLPPWDTLPGPDLTTTTTPAVTSFLYQGQMVRYQVAAGDDGMLDLWRSVTGRFDNAGVVVAPPAGNWQMVAHGIDDFQVEYMDGNGTWLNNAPAIPCAITDTGATPPATCTDADKLRAVRSVRLTLSARTIAMRNTPGAPGGIIRGRATTVVAVRATMAARRLENKGF
jgi:prepilin-type N-terminal cleavage/methylation domain-containing protein